MAAVAAEEAVEPAEAVAAGAAVVELASDALVVEVSLSALSSRELSEHF